MAETVLITGPSSGIGLELARCFAAAKSDLVLVARREDKLRQLAEELRARFGVQVRVVAKDLSLAAAPREIAETLNNMNVTVDVLVNNAGFGDLGPFAELPLERQMEMVQVNAAALTELTHRLLPGMIARARGGILNVASTAGFQPGPLMTVYYATKAYVISFSEGLAGELAGTGVAVSCLCPGPTATEFVSSAEMPSTRLFRLGAMSAAAVARIGYEGFRSGRVLVVPGPMNKLGVLSLRVSPRFLVRKVTKWLHG